MVVGIWAILLCGAQYVPLDGGVVPDSTLRHVLAESGGSVMVCTWATEKRLRRLFPATYTVIVEQHGGVDAIPTANHGWIDLTSPTSGCYVIYTSGTTGRPKGVDVTHANVVNLVCQYPGNLGVTPGTRVGQVLNISFDMAAWEIFSCLCNGGTLVIRGSDWEPAMCQIDVLICTPSILSKYHPSRYPNIRVAATAGEPTTQGLADLWATQVAYWNCCGPTETTIVNTMSKHVAGQPLNIGKPTPNNNVYILNEEMQPVGLGETGVMWAGGSGVSRGYIGLEQETKESYLIDPFLNNGMHMYCTGDLGYWDASGNIRILGRCDDQIKIKGFRVELDGVSASLLSTPGIVQAVALFLDGEIHAFISPQAQDEARILACMAERQPYYAMPAMIHQLQSFPVTANGKTDKKALKRAYAEAKMYATKCISTDSEKSDCATLVENLSALPATAALPGETGSDCIPQKKLPQPLRGLIHRILIVYCTLFTFVILTNTSILSMLLYTHADLQFLQLVASANLTLAVMVRQDGVVNMLYTIFCSVPKTAPLWLRRRCGLIYHLGGVHSAAGVCSTLWLLSSSITSTISYAQVETRTADSIASIVISWMICGLCSTMIGFAYPTIRKRYHNAFEQTHRFLGWTTLLLFWIKILLNAIHTTEPGKHIAISLAQNPALWLLVVATCSVASSWLFLRKVPVETKILSDHAAVLSFRYTIPVNGSFTRISTRPLLEWHSFATIPQQGPNALVSAEGYSLVISNAGDWTRSCIQNPPRSIWVRGRPTCGVMRIATLFNRIVIIATGSGIGPLLGHIQRPSCSTQLIWSTKNPRKTFGKAILDSIYKTIPDAIIHDTEIDGRPDLTKMGYNLAVSFRAEAVIIIANEKITKKVVYGLETRGIPAYGAIWDS